VAPGPAVFQRRTTDVLVRYRIWLLVILAVALRLAYSVFVVSPRLTDDELHFWRIAGNVLHGKGYSYAGQATAWRPPVYTYALSAMRWLHLGVRGVQVVQAIIGALTPLLLIACARRARLPAWAALVAGFVGAIYPPFIHVASQALSENLSVPLLLAAVWLTLWTLDEPRRWPLAASCGATWGLAILARPSAIPALVIGLVVVALRRPSASIAMVITGAAVVMPWVIRDDRAVGGPVAVVSNESFTLWVSNRLDARALKDVFRDPRYPGLQDYGVYGRAFPGIEQLAASKGFDFDAANEYQRDRWFRQLVIHDVKASPWRFVRRAAAKSVLALDPAPANASQQEKTSTAAKLILWITTAPVILFGLIGLGLLMAKGDSGGRFLAIAAIVSLVGVAIHLPYVRYRVGSVDPFLILGTARLLPPLTGHVGRLREAKADRAAARVTRARRRRL
jgi:hypothetical protein